MEQEQQRRQRQLDLFPEFERQPFPEQREVPGGRQLWGDPLPVQAARERHVAALSAGLHLAPSHRVMPRA